MCVRAYKDIHISPRPPHRLSRQAKSKQFIKALGDDKAKLAAELTKLGSEKTKLAAGLTKLGGEKTKLEAEGVAVREDLLAAKKDLQVAEKEGLAARQVILSVFVSLLGYAYIHTYVYTYTNTYLYTYIYV